MARTEINKKYYVAIAALMVVLSYFFWYTPVVYPVKVFTVVMHEISHGLAALASGGTIVRIDIVPELGGVCYTRGGARLLVLSAGYVGSILWGCAILLMAIKTNLDRALSMAIGVALFVVVALYVRSPFGIVFCLGFGAALILVGRYAPAVVNELVLVFLGLTSALYAVLDIKEDLISRTVPGSDAYQMSQLLPLPPVVWGVLWIALALAAIVWTFRAAFGCRGRGTD